MTPSRKDRPSKTPEEQPNHFDRGAALVLLANGLLGFMLGALVYPTMQYSVEYGQVVSGALQYPPGVPEGVLKTNLWAVVNQLSALGILGGLSEDFLSVLICGVMGMLSFQALGLSMYAVSSRTLIASVTPLLLFYCHATNFGRVYPVILAGFYNTHGILGLSYILLVLAVFGTGWYRCGAVLLGMAPAWHAVLGGAMWIAIPLAWAWGRREWGTKERNLAKWFLGGLFILLVSLAAHLTRLAPVPEAPRQEVRELFVHFVQTWDFHRRPVEFLSYEVWLNLVGLAVCATFMYKARPSQPERIPLMFRAIMITGFLGLGFGVMTLLPVEWVPPVLVRAMPARLLNLFVIAYPALILGMLVRRDARTAEWLYGALMAALFSISVFFAPLSTPYGVFSLLVGGGVVVAGARFYPSSGHLTNKPPALRTKIEKFVLIFIALSVAPLIPLALLNVNSELLSRLHMKGGGKETYSHDLLLLSSAIADSDSAQYYLKRPILLDVSKLDNLCYAPELLPMTAAMLKHVYGVDLLNAPASAHRSAQLPPGIERNLWEARSLSEWQEVRDKYQVVDVLAPADWRLRLPSGQGRSTSRGPALFYHIPESPESSPDSPPE